MQLTDAEWDEVRVAYGADIDGVAKIAKRFGIKPHDIYSRRSQEGWPSRANRGLGIANSKLKRPVTLAHLDLTPEPAGSPDGIETAPEDLPVRRPKKPSLNATPDQMMKPIRRVVYRIIKNLDERSQHDQVQITQDQTEAVKHIDQLVKILERSKAMSADDQSPNKPQSNARQDGKERAVAAARLRHEIADRLERLLKDGEPVPKTRRDPR